MASPSNEHDRVMERARQANADVLARAAARRDAGSAGRVDAGGLSLVGSPVFDTVTGQRGVVVENRFGAARSDTRVVVRLDGGDTVERVPSAIFAVPTPPIARV